MNAIWGRLLLLDDHRCRLKCVDFWRSRFARWDRTVRGCVIWRGCGSGIRGLHNGNSGILGSFLYNFRGWLSINRSIGLVVSLILFVGINRLFLQEAENVVEDKVAVGLLSKEESLRKLTPRFATVRHLTDDLDDDATVRRRLCIH